MKMENEKEIKGKENSNCSYSTDPLNHDYDSKGKIVKSQILTYKNGIEYVPTKEKFVFTERPIKENYKMTTIFTDGSKKIETDDHREFFGADGKLHSSWGKNCLLGYGGGRTDDPETDHPSAKTLYRDGCEAFVELVKVRPENECQEDN